MHSRNREVPYQISIEHWIRQRIVKNTTKDEVTFTVEDGALGEEEDEIT